MFEQTINRPDESSRTRILILSSVLFVATVATGAGLYRAFLYHKDMPRVQGLAGAQQAGTPDYDSYSKQIAITNQEASYSENALGGRQIVAIGRVQNLGNRTIKGLEVRAVAYDFDGKPIAERLAAPIPRATPDPLKPNETLPISVVIDGAPEEVLVREIKLELHGLIF
jgi:hypothetical protein